MTLLPRLLAASDDQREAELERKLLRIESKIGRRIFGPVPKNHHRDFFCLDEKTWIWHEDWLDDNGQHVVISTRFVLRPDGVIKSQNGDSYKKVETQESRHLYLAIQKYVELVRNHYYHMLQA